MKTLSICCVCVAIPIVMLAVQDNVPSAQLLESTANQIAISAQSLHFNDAAGKQAYESVKDQETLRIQRFVDDFINQGIDSQKSDATAIQKGLQTLLRHQPSDEYAGPPFAVVDELRFGHSLVTAYMLSRGPLAVNDSAVTIKGYKVHGGKFLLADTTGQDFDGYGLFIKPLTSPMPGETWLFVWGQRYGFNGNKTRMRVYAFDGERFRTLWNPPDVFNMSVEFNKDGFDVTRIDEDRYQKKINPSYMRDVYRLLQDGPHLNSSSYVAEP